MQPRGRERDQAVGYVTGLKMANHRHIGAYQVIT